MKYRFTIIIILLALIEVLTGCSALTKLSFRSSEEASEVQVIEGISETVTIEEARQVAKFPILIPTKMPKGFSLQEVQLTKWPALDTYDSSVWVHLIYKGASGDLTITQMPLLDEIKELEHEHEEMIGEPKHEHEHEEIIEGKQVQIHDSQATLLEPTVGTRVLQWQKNKVGFTIVGQVDEETILEVAELLQ